ncbi:MAG: hypothetical protein ACE5I1_32870 [bacterium]
MKILTSHNLSYQSRKTMWHIVKAEIDYNKKLLLAVSLLIPLVCFYENAIADERIGYVLLSIYMATTFWNIFRNKDKRDLQLVPLPLSARQLALARMATIAIVCLGFSIFYLLIYFLFHFQGPPESIKLLAYWGIILSGFSIYYVLRDLYKSSFRKFGLTKTRIKWIAILFALGLNFMIFYAIYQTKATGEVHYFIHYLDKVNLLADPPANAVQIVIFLVFSIVFAYSTAFTFGWRKSFLE